VVAPIVVGIIGVILERTTIRFLYGRMIDTMLATWGLRQAGFAPASGRTVLSTLSVISVIDDDASVRAAANNLLNSNGYVVHTFASAEKFLQSTHLNDTSCVITDVQMPVTSGVELLKTVGTQGYRAPFIFITAFPDKSVRARALGPEPLAS
jgi:CheY-like chemotaxis protein